MATSVLLLLKAHNKGYNRKDGTHVGPFDDKRPAAKPAQGSLFKPAKWSALASMKAKDAPGKQPTGLYGKVASSDHAKDLQQGAFAPSASKPFKLPASAVPHPKKGEDGKPVHIHYPSEATGPETWADPEAIATWTPGSPVPKELNGIPFSPWEDHPRDGEAWDYVDGQNDDLEEPALELSGGKKPASGVIVLEPDGRVWVVAPTNRFGGVKNTFPKGSRDYGLSLQANAIKEAYEECGLKVEIDSFLGDIPRSTSVARYYLARRVGGTPAAMGWESQAVRLVPADKLRDFLDRGEDKKIADWLEGLV